jgi:POT family proton-dependent oligopeptide transporter
MTQRTFLGHPRGLAYLAFTEMWERFSYYGMISLLLLYMVQELLLAGSIENVAGMDGLRTVLESVFGPLTAQQLGSQIFGFYSGLVYLTPIIGGWLADRFFGTTRMVVAGVLLMTAGHFLMTFDTSFLIALLLLIVGSGALKGNIASQVGQLYPSGEESRRSRGYLIFSTGINIGALLGSLVCGVVAQVYGWHFGFGLAGLMMLVALGVYLAGRRYLPAPPQPNKPTAPREPLRREDRLTLVLIVLILAIAAFGFTGWALAFNAGFIWTEAHVDLTTPLGAVPMAWFVSLDALMSIAAPISLIVLWRELAKRGREPGDLTKIGIGLLLLGLCMLVFAFGAFSAGDGRTNIAFPLITFMLTGAGFMCAWPVILALVSRRSPPQVKAMMMGVAYLVAFASSTFAGVLSGQYETMPPERFFLAMAVIPSVAGLVLLVTRNRLIRALDANAHPVPTKSHMEQPA